MDTRPVLVWGEPTLATFAVGETDLVHDGSIRGRVVRVPGGSAYATAYALGALGAPVRFFGPVASDEAGVHCAEFLASIGVEVNSFPAQHSRQTVIFVSPDGARSMVGDPGDAFETSYADHVTDTDLSQASMLYLSLSSVASDPRDKTYGLVMRAKSLSVPVVVDVGSGRVVEQVAAQGRLHAVLKDTIVIANHDEAEVLDRVSESNARSWTRVLIVKHGAEPTDIFTAETHEQVCVNDVISAVDTTGAGDAFAAGFVAGCRQGLDCVDAVRWGHLLARHTVGRVGTVVDVDALHAAIAAADEPADVPSLLQISSPAPSPSPRAGS